MHEYQQESEKQDNFIDCPTQQNFPKAQQPQQPYIKSAFQIYSRKSFLPSYQVKYELSLLREKLLLEKQKLKEELAQQKMLEQTIGEEELGLYRAKKKQSSEYRLAIGVVERVKAIYKVIQQQLDYNVLITETYNHDEHLQNQQQAFTHLLQAIDQFNTFYFQHHEAMRELNKTSKDQQKALFLSNLYGAITQAVEQKTVKDSKFVHDRLERIMKTYDLPVRRNQKPKQRQSRTPQMQHDDKQLLQRLLHWQSCHFALRNLSLIPTDTYLSSSLPSSSPNQLLHYKSPFFTLYYEKLQSSISYLFIKNHQSHSFNEPNWMFQYIQDVFVANYQWLRDNVMSGMRAEAEGNLLVYVLQYALERLFYNNIKSRLQADLSTPSFLTTPIHSYKFIDTLYQLQQKLNITFSQHLTLVQSILIEFQLTQNSHLLEKCFDYQHKWIEQKIFKGKDFWENINYSNIDVKNIQTYNIVVNFNVLFQKLYAKFSTVRDPQLVKLINRFYQQQIRNLVAHIKTSLQRIYYHSGLDKLSVILAFKRVDNQFRSGLGQFIAGDLQFQKEIRKEYYDYLLGLFNQLSVEMLAVYARRLLKAVTELEYLFNAKTVTQQQHLLLKTKSEHIFKKWQHKMQQLNLVYPVKDNKMKNQFFVLLQSIVFNEKGTLCVISIQIGIMMFIEFYQQFLKMTYGIEQFNILKMVILMDKKQQLEYLKVNASGTGGQLNFLLESQSTAIRKVVIK